MTPKDCRFKATAINRFFNVDLPSLADYLTKCPQFLPGMQKLKTGDDFEFLRVNRWLTILYKQRERLN